MKRFYLFAAAVFLLNTYCFATILNVPAQFATIQSALNAVSHGDTILVAPGTYFENLRFNGKNVVLTSQFIFSRNVQHIRTTIINGSQPANPDTASVVRFINGETSNAVLMGFTITGGTGTKWPDVHLGGTVFREGGGILCEGSSPTIQYNLITGNKAIQKNPPLVLSAGGGAIRADGGQPRILNNVISNNQGLYGGGIVLNYSGGIIRNNVIFKNTGGEDFGGSGIWILEKYAAAPKIIENNTIIGNHSDKAGPGIRIQDATAELRNNIIWGNTGPTTQQVQLMQGGVLNASYNNIQGGFAGVGSINLNPQFADSAFLLLPNSPATDSGDPATAFNDPAAGGSGTVAVHPSRGNLRNDMGAYGGPGSFIFPVFSAKSFVAPSVFMFGNQPAGSHTRYIKISNNGSVPLLISNISLKTGTVYSITGFPARIKPVKTDSIAVTWNPTAAGVTTDSVLIYHNDSSQPSPKKIWLRGNAVLGLKNDLEKEVLQFNIAGKNPVSESLNLTYFLPETGTVQLAVFNMLGQEVKSIALEKKSRGNHYSEIKTAELPSGVYTARLMVSKHGLPEVRTMKFVKE